MSLPPRILVLVPVVGVKCAAGHPLDVRPNLHRREWFQQCHRRRHDAGEPCGAWMHFKPSGEGWVLTTDCTQQQVRDMELRVTDVLEIAERVAADYRASLRRRRA